MWLPVSASTGVCGPLPAPDLVSPLFPGPEFWPTLPASPVPVSETDVEIVGGSPKFLSQSALLVTACSAPASNRSLRPDPTNVCQLGVKSPKNAPITRDSASVSEAPSAMNSPP